VATGPGSLESLLVEMQLILDSYLPQLKQYFCAILQKGFFWLSFMKVCQNSPFLGASPQTPSPFLHTHATSWQFGSLY